MNLGFVVVVQDLENSSQCEMHTEAWVGGINLPEDMAKQLCQMFKCVQFRSN